MSGTNLDRRVDALVELMPRIMGSIAIARLHVRDRGAVDLTFNQYRALRLIHDQGECSVNALAQRLGIAQSTTSQLVDRLARARLVRREPHAADRRRMAVALTSTGRRMMELRTRAIKEAYLRIFSLLTEEQRRKFERAFRDFHEVACMLEEKFRRPEGR